MVEIRNKQFLIDGKPEQILSGEIHYFRLARDEWADRLDKLVDTGMNAVATYIPWIVHELVEGEVDLHGQKRDFLDLEAFITMAEERYLYVFVRPGPFVMAELKNEGIPDWVYEKYPDVQARTWDGKEVTTRTVDYLHPGFLEEVRKWYSHVMPIIARHLYGNGGRIIALQLDNEIGMLSWVSNNPDLSPATTEDMRSFAITKRNDPEAALPEDLLSDAKRFLAFVRHPSEDHSLAYHHLLGLYNRDRYSRYADILKAYAEEFGVRNIPFAINIHGTGGGRGLTYPIGLQQLYETFPGKANFFSGTDIYLGDLDMPKFQDLYILNAMTDAVNDHNQPLTSLEFECGDSNYGERLNGRNDPSAADFKARMTIGQGGRLLNYYLFTGGRNFRITEYKRKDGNDRIAITGERHGFAAPVSPEGHFNYTYQRMKESIQVLRANDTWLCRMTEEHDNLVLGFIPDYFMTEYHYPHSSSRQSMLQDLEAWRARIPWETVLKGIMVSNYRFRAVDLQKNLPLVEEALVLPSALYMSRQVQEQVIRHVQAGGELLLYGELPEFDMAGKPCRLLQEYLGVESLPRVMGAPGYQPSLVAKGFLADRADIQTGMFQPFLISGTADRERIRLSGEELLCPYDREGLVGVSLGHLPGRVVLITAEYSADPVFWKRIMEHLGIQAAFSHDDPHKGIFITASIFDPFQPQAPEEGIPEKTRLIHIFNLDGMKKELRIRHKDTILFGGGTLSLRPRDALMLPFYLDIGPAVIIGANCEIWRKDQNSVSFKGSLRNHNVVLDSLDELANADQFEIKQIKGGWLVSPKREWMEEIAHSGEDFADLTLEFKRELTAG